MHSDQIHEGSTHLLQNGFEAHLDLAMNSARYAQHEQPYAHGAIGTGWLASRGVCRIYEKKTRLY